jgi:hypothetical protein
MFYASVARAAVFFELRAAPGDCLTVSRWSLTEKIFANNIGFTPDVFQRYRSTRNELVPDWVVRNPANRIVHEFLARQFTVEVPPGMEHQYKLSVAIAEKLWGNITGDVPTDAPRDMRFGAIVYPSLAMRANSDNLVLLPHFVDKCARLEQVEYIRVDAWNGDLEYKVTKLDFANTFPNGNIEWKGRLPQWQVSPGGQLKLSVDEQGQWVAHDDLGRLVEPN